jgi:hypothetical protein
MAWFFGTLSTISIAGDSFTVFSFHSAWEGAWFNTFVKFISCCVFVRRLGNLEIQTV